jgi:hypothetical protein
MSKKKNLFVSKNANKFKITPLIDSIANVDEKDFETVFKAEMHTWMCIVLDGYLNETSDQLKDYAYLYIDNGVIYFNKYYMELVGFLVYQGVLIKGIKQLSFNKKLNEDVLVKLNAYKAYLTQNEKRFFELDTIIRLISKKESFKNLLELSQLIVKKPLIDMKLLNEAQNDLFYHLDRLHINMLLNPKEHVKNQVEDSYLLAKFDFEYYKNPPIYYEYPKEKKIYLKFLKSWLLEALEFRKKMFRWNTLPLVYQHIEKYANSLLLKSENKKKPKEQETVQIVPKFESLQGHQYPAHIFKSYQTYHLFQVMAEEFKSASQISFLYRMMAEKENPPFILVKDTPFRDWFNAENYSLKLGTHTKTLSNASNNDRIATYKLVKKLIINKS